MANRKRAVRRIALGTAVISVAVSVLAAPAGAGPQFDTSWYEPWAGLPSNQEDPPAIFVECTAFGRVELKRSLVDVIPLRTNGRPGADRTVRAEITVTLNDCVDPFRPTFAIPE